MNDFQMTFLATARQATLAAEADRERLARAARPQSPRRPVRRPRRQAGLGLLFGRVGIL